MVTILGIQDWKKFKAAQWKIHRELLEEIQEVSGDGVGDDIDELI